MHDLIAADASSKQLVVASTPEYISDIQEITKSQVVLSLATLSFSELMELRSWDIKGLAYSLKGFCGISDAELPAVLEQLTSCGDSGMRPGTGETRTQLLADLRRADLVTSSVNDNGVECWRLTTSGKQHTQVGVRLADSRRVFQQRDRPVREMDVFDLMLTLKEAGWSMQAVSLRADMRQVVGAPYVAGKKKRLWYVRPNQDSVSKEYLMCLATAPEHNKPVPHFAPHATYCTLLGVMPRKQRKFQVVHVDADDWGEASVEPAKPKRRRAASAQASMPRAKRPREDDVDSGDAGGEDAGSQSDHGTVVSEELESSPASSAVSFSIESAESEENTEVSESDMLSQSAPVAQQEASQPHAIGAGRNMTSSLPWGPCRLTPTPTGWQMSCGLPGHEACTKTRSNKFGGEELVLRMLKYWVVLGDEKQAPDKAAHVALWSEVLAADIPSADALHARRPRR